MAAPFEEREKGRVYELDVSATRRVRSGVRDVLHLGGHVDHLVAANNAHPEIIEIEYLHPASLGLPIAPRRRSAAKLRFLPDRACP